MIDIVPERLEDADAVESLLDSAFGSDRFTKISYSYRTGVARCWPLCLVARNGAEIVGTIRYWPITIGRTPALLLGPVAVRAEYRAHGLGGDLIRTSLAQAAQSGHRAVLLVGDEPYYGRFGFRLASAHGAVMPHEKAHRVLALSLDPLDPAVFPAGTVRPSRSTRRTAA
jgi:predicted N-acetyltransferase YhbS